MATSTVGLLAPAYAAFLFLRRSGTRVEYVFCYLKMSKHVCLKNQRPFVCLDLSLLPFWKQVKAVRLRVVDL